MGQLGPERVVVEDYSAEMLGPGPISTSILNRGREVIPLAIEPGDPNGNGSPVHPVTGFPFLEVRLIALEDHHPFVRNVTATRREEFRSDALVGVVDEVTG
jgi:hypothetical protein